MSCVLLGDLGAALLYWLRSYDDRYLKDRPHVIIIAHMAVVVLIDAMAMQSNFASCTCTV